jgi:aminopeptidase N
MWFGNLVSPQWWDGLWLNESFATFMAAYAVFKATRFGELSWMEFNSSMKKWAEREDQQSTTHPIQVQPPSSPSFSFFAVITGPLL